MPKKTLKEQNGSKKMFWSIVSSVAIIFGLLGGFYGIDDRYAKSEDLKKQEQQTIKSLEMFQQKLESKFLFDRMQTLQDQKRQLKIMLKKTPNDTDLQDQYKDVEEEIKATKNRLDELQKK